jgi:GSH-dependent disulfide-bond oxidoreductase
MILCRVATCYLDFLLTGYSLHESIEMIDLYSWPTPNGHKVHILLEETGLPYQVHAVDIAAGDQFKPDFLKISPNNKIPAMVDSSGPSGKPFALFESGALLVYLAAKAHMTDQLVGKTDAQRFITLQWLMFQMGGFGPMLGQAHHFRIYAPEKIEYAVNRYTSEAKRLYNVLDKELAHKAYVAGDFYSIADIAVFPWTRSTQNQGIDWADFPNVKRWHDEIAARPAVQRGVAVLADRRKPVSTLTAEQRDQLFGKAQYERKPDSK